MFKPAPWVVAAQPSGDSNFEWDFPSLPQGTAWGIGRTRLGQLEQKARREIDADLAARHPARVGLQATAGRESRAL